MCFLNIIVTNKHFFPHRTLQGITDLQNTLWCVLLEIFCLGKKYGDVRGKTYAHNYDSCMHPPSRHGNGGGGNEWREIPQRGQLLWANKLSNPAAPPHQEHFIGNFPSFWVLFFFKEDFPCAWLKSDSRKIKAQYLPSRSTAKGEIEKSYNRASEVAALGIQGAVVRPMAQLTWPKV